MFKEGKLRNVRSNRISGYVKNTYNPINDLFFK